MLENGPEVPTVWVGTSCSAVLSHPFPEEDEAVERHAGLTSPGPGCLVKRSPKDGLTEVFRLGKAARRFLRWVLRTERTQRFVEAATAGGQDEAESQHLRPEESAQPQKSRLRFYSDAAAGLVRLLS